MLVVDAANVIGSRPTGWWRDRAGAAREFAARVVRAVDAGALDPPVVLVLEGAARGGVAAGSLSAGVTVVHAAASGDDAIVDVVGTSAGPSLVVTADRGLRARLADLEVDTRSPGWLLTHLDAGA